MPKPLPETAILVDIIYEFDRLHRLAEEGEHDIDPSVSDREAVLALVRRFRTASDAFFLAVGRSTDPEDAGSELIRIFEESAGMAAEAAPRRRLSDQDFDYRAAIGAIRSF